MEQRRNDAAGKDVPINLRKEACASSMGQKDCAKAKVAQIKLSEEECAEGMGQHTNYASK